MKKKVILSLIIIIGIGLPVFCVLTIFKEDYPSYRRLNYEVEPLLQVDLTVLGIDQVTEIDWSPGGNYIAIGTYQGQISLVDADTGEVIRQFQADDYPISKLSWSPDGTFLASVSEYLSVNIWNPHQGKVVDSLPGNLEDEEYYFSSTPLAWSEDGKSLVFADKIKDIMIVRSVEVGENTLELAFSDSVYALSSNEEGILIFTGEEIKMLDIEKQEFDTVAYLGEIELSRRNKGRWAIYDADFSVLGELVLIDTVLVNISDVLYFLRFLDYRDGADPITYSYPGARLLSWSDDGKYLAVGTWDGEIGVVSRANMDYVHSLGTFSDAQSTDAVAWSPDGEKVAAVGDEDILVVFHVSYITMSLNQRTQRCDPLGSFYKEIGF